jgi:hypothetical protein
VSINTTPNKNIVTKILKVPAIALLTAFSPSRGLREDNMKPSIAEKRENIKNLTHAGIGINAKIKINKKLNK